MHSRGMFGLLSKILMLSCDKVEVYVESCLSADIVMGDSATLVTRWESAKRTIKYGCQAVDFDMCDDGVAGSGNILSSPSMEVHSPSSDEFEGVLGESNPALSLYSNTGTRTAIAA